MGVGNKDTDLSDARQYSANFSLKLNKTYPSERVNICLSNDNCDGSVWIRYITTEKLAFINDNINFTAQSVGIWGNGSTDVHDAREYGSNLKIILSGADNSEQYLNGMGYWGTSSWIQSFTSDKFYLMNDNTANMRNLWVLVSQQILTVMLEIGPIIYIYTL